MNPSILFGLICEAEEQFGHRSTWTQPEVRDRVASWIAGRVREIRGGVNVPKPAPAPFKSWYEPRDVDLGSQFDEFGKL